VSLHRLEGEGREKKSGGEVGEEWGDIGEGRDRKSVV